MLVGVEEAKIAIKVASTSMDNLISAMNKHTSTPYPAYAGLGKLDDVGKTADKFEDWYLSVKKSMMKTDTPSGSGVKVSGPVDELNPKALNEAGEQIAKKARWNNCRYKSKKWYCNEDSTAKVN